MKRRASCAATVDLPAPGGPVSTTTFSATGANLARDPYRPHRGGNYRQLIARPLAPGSDVRAARPFDEERK
ncbi:hypothetical protein CCE01nite_31600 [Cellulomonas cellasea]|uniref:Uncharacterized protein n=1 Tax=Cellulomonas cellasea TaxID=43670 RepID=A0A4Y3KXK3_9CELL|nr:hypothetical protein CCE01nite_31600 [Cellulomonas cellasea]